jgi:2'-5' RNA ligase
MPRAGVTAVLVAVPPLDPLLAAEASRAGVPAHLTILYPFADAADLTPGIVERCRQLCAATAPVTVTFEDAVVWPEIVATVPSPAAPLAALTRAFTSAFPEYPPYGGRFGADPQPHVTLAVSPDATLVAPFAPVRAQLRGAVLVELTESGWNELASLPFLADGDEPRGSALRR